jgi:hypothetical protein
MRRPVRSFASALALAVALVGATAALTSVSGCDDPRSIDWQVKHLADSNPIERGKALEGISQQWKNADQSNDEAKKKEFKDKAIAELAKAYQSDAVKESSKDRNRIMDILSLADDKRATPAFIFAFKNYKPGDNDDEVKKAARAVLKNKTLFAGDEELGKGLVAGLKKVKFANPRSGEIGAMFGDCLGAIKAKGTMADLLAVVTSPNDGQDTLPNKELTAQQAISASALGEVADASIVPQLIDAMFENASKMAKRKDSSTGEDVEQASPLTTGVSMLIGGALAKIGEPAIAPLMPFVKDDQNDPKVKEVKAKFAKYISPGGSGRPTAYVDIATTTVANIGLPKVAAEVAALVRDKKTKDADRKPLIGLLVSLPADQTVQDAIKEGFANSGTDKLKGDIAASASRLMDPGMTDWLLGIANDKKASDDIKDAALSSAIWLAPKEKIGEVKAAYDKMKKLDKTDPTWRAMEPTPAECDPTKLKGKEKEMCAEHPEDKKPDGKPKFVVWKDVTPKYSEELQILTDQLTKCDKDANCYFLEFQAAVKEVDKQGLTKVTESGTRAGIKMQKAAWMLAAYGKEDDMVALVNYMPNISSPAPRSFVQMALDKNLKNGSNKVADAIAKLVKSEREKGSETANREAAQLEPIANKLRARAGTAKK